MLPKFVTQELRLQIINIYKIFQLYLLKHHVIPVNVFTAVALRIYKILSVTCSIYFNLIILFKEIVVLKNF